MAEALLTIENVNAFYGTAQALEDVSLTVSGGAVAIVGRNGMGKTTLCQAIMGLVPIRDGQITLKGRPIGLFPDLRGPGGQCRLDRPGPEYRAEFQPADAGRHHAGRHPAEP